MRMARILSTCVLMALNIAAGDEFRLAVFEADVTIPIGHACMGGGIPAAKEILDPLYARGVVLLGEAAPIVWVSVDWCEIRNAAYDDWRQSLADAAGTSRERVLVSSVHQHDAPVVDYAAQSLLDGVGLPQALCDVAFAKNALGRVAYALRASLPTARPVTHVGVGQAKVVGVASNRRVVTHDGIVVYHRGSATKDRYFQDQPEGRIDPLLKTLSFWDGDTAVAALHAYATHPMSYYGQGGVTADFVGLARARRQADAPSIHQVYFSGCSGDVTAGKYNDGSPGNRAILASRIYDAMTAAWRDTVKHPLTSVTVRTAPLHLEPKGGTDFDEADMRRILADPEETVFRRNLAAMGLSWRARVATGQAIDVVAVDFGAAVFLQLPGESFVQYQLTAQALRMSAAVITAGYGECAPGYIPTGAAANEGFHRESWCWVAEGAETAMVAALRAVLTP